MQHRYSLHSSQAQPRPSRTPLRLGAARAEQLQLSSIIARSCKSLEAASTARLLTLPLLLGVYSIPMFIAIWDAQTTIARLLLP